jgi:hypothetical protein
MKNSGFSYAKNVGGYGNASQVERAVTIKNHSVQPQAYWREHEARSLL